MVSAPSTIIGLYLCDANVIKHHVCTYIYSVVDMSLLLPVTFSNLVVLSFALLQVVVLSNAILSIALLLMLLSCQLHYC